MWLFFQRHFDTNLIAFLRFVVLIVVFLKFDPFWPHLQILQIRLASVPIHRSLKRQPQILFITGTAKGQLPQKAGKQPRTLFTYGFHKDVARANAT